MTDVPVTVKGVDKTWGRAHGLASKLGYGMAMGYELIRLNSLSFMKTVESFYQLLN